MDEHHDRGTGEPPGRTSKSVRPWHGLPVEEVGRELDVDVASGLSGSEVERRRATWGPNRLEETGRATWLEVLFRQFRDALIIVLALAALFALALGEVMDAAAILAILLANGLLGFAQEWRAERSLQALKRLLSPRCRVRRDGHPRQVPAESLVPGDVVLLGVGDLVPADLRLLETASLRLDQSLLTGESEPVAKSAGAVAREAALADRSSLAHAGATVTHGHATGLTVATGMATELGRIAALTRATTPETTPLQRRLGRLGRQLGALALGISGLVALIGWLSGKPPLDMLLVGVSLAVAAVPEGLPAVVTLTLAIGVRSMARRRALLRHLHAAEGLGETSVICTDKTGTLTKNEMTVQRVVLARDEIDVGGLGYRPVGRFERGGEPVDALAHPDLPALLETGRACNVASLERSQDEGWRPLGEPTEAALLVLAGKAGLPPGPQVERVGELSFSSERKRMSVVERGADGALTSHVKGAPEVLLPRCTRLRDGGVERELGDADRERFERARHELAATGLRTLALAVRRLDGTTRLDEELLENDLTLLGLVGMMDPPREEVPAAIATAHRAGIRVILITGDAAETALAVARRVGLAVERAVTGAELARMRPEELTETLREPVLLARTSPEQKLDVIRALRRDGHVVAMTGDGVNDAPALKEADVGVAMGQRGTDVAKGAADMVLTDDNFASIVGAVEEGRRQFANIQKFVRYLMASNLGEVLAIFVGVVIGGPLILLPVHVLWMNLITDGVTALALGLEPVEPDAMDQPPRRPHQPLLGRAGLLVIALIGSWVGGACLWAFYWSGQEAGGGAAGSIEHARTLAFTTIILAEMASVLNFRALRCPLLVIGPFSNPWILLGLLVNLGLQVSAVHAPFMQPLMHTVPLSLADWGLAAGLAVPLVLAGELVKWLLWRGRRVGAPRAA